ncbi:glycosyltransferase family 4 protein [Dyadobacter sandarakinus]|uniref:Glycosyltransferase family 4 protein n=1 Tax=Dyadobacter sandarakinus TaxID=2747268 RepID=A0ABX7I0R5_9BACT|nr:glycosyltransferase family 4 protein [Dyadobacter sandarakinus]QRQ99640.1 glycosyltransferase family 4 protein [Dyadobacter sandarakinus]
MRILIIHNQLWAHYKSRLFNKLYEALKKQAPGSDMQVIQIALYERSRKAMQPDNTIVYDYPYCVLFQKSLEEVSLKERTKALFQAFNAYKPTILNITGYADWAQVALMAYARSKGVKVVISSESSVMDQQRSFWKEGIKKLILRQAQGFFCFGKSPADYLVSLGVRKQQILVQHGAVIDEDVISGRYQLAAALPRPENVRRFIFVGRLAPEKNLSMLIRAFDNITSVRTGTYTWELVLAGDGSESAMLQNLAHKSAASANIHFTGGMPWYQVPGQLARADVLVLPSLSEPWGLVVNEAMTCGMAVIVSEKCGCVQDLVVNGQNGFTFDPLRQPDLEKAMLYFVQHPDRISSMGRESEKLVAPFSSTKVAAQMAAAFQSL